MAAELSLDGTFELSSSDADVLVRVNSSAPLWHKEALLNVALAAVPRSVRFVAWLDCDILFERQDWSEALVSKLESNKVVQLFQSLHDLNPDESLSTGLPADARHPTGVGIASLIEHGGVPRTAFAPESTNDMRKSSFGIAWGARTDLIRSHGFYDAMVLGSGDRAMLCAATGDYHSAISTLHLSASRARHYLNWAQPYFQTVDGRVGHIPGSVYHLWHGTIADRNYHARHQLLAEQEFDLDVDLSKDEFGIWQWRRPRPDLDDLFRKYFRDRREDEANDGRNVPTYERSHES